MFKAVTLVTSALLFTCKAQDIPGTACVCDTQYDPVCCQGQYFSNSCNAECVGFEPDTDCASGTCDDTTVDCVLNCAAVDSDPYCCNYLFYDNSCLASCDGFTVDTDCEAGECALKQLGEDCGYSYNVPTESFNGECADGLYCEPNLSIPDLPGTCVALNVTVNPTVDPECTCTTEYDPVCCAGIEFSNDCFANCAFIGVDITAECTSGRCSNITTTDDCTCPENYAPVCCGDEEYSNSCFAGCDGFGDDECDDGACEDDDGCVCIELYAPVCCNGETFGNDCKAGCEGGIDDVDATCTSGACVDDVCVCTEQYDPMCCADQTYGNSCNAACDGFGDDDCTAGACEDDGCVCAEVYDPVCCSGQTFGNACAASCEGGIEDVNAQCSLGECEDGCTCITLYDPVCCDNSEQFSNDCEAACQGYNNSASCVQGECDLGGVSGAAALRVGGLVLVVMVCAGLV